jgi:ubiquinone/menaquinone biosynthesis C-methylase UbiE
MNSYQENFEKNVALSGWDATLFAEYKALRLKELVPDLVERPISILDFGCGDGLMSSFIKHIFTNATVVGVDTCAESIDVARMAYDDIHFSVATKKISAADESFDLVIAAEVFHHISFQEHDYYLHELMRVLKPGGLLVIFELNPLNPATLYRFKRDPSERTARLLSPRYTKNMLQQYGQLLTLNFYSFFPHWLRALSFLERYMTKIPFGAFYACVVQKK